MAQVIASKQQPLLTKEYETIYVLRSDIDAESAEKVQNRFSEVVEREAGKLLKVEAWGRRKLAYPVAKQRRGVYVYVKYIGKGGLVQEIERNLRLQDSVIKFQTVLLRENVNVAEIAVDPEEIKFQRLELPPEDDEKESREKALGLVDFHTDHHRSRHVERDDDFDNDDFGMDEDKKDSDDDIG